MRLTQWTDYSLRVLMYCAACAGREAPVTITEISDGHAISRSHLTKIVQELAALGWLETTRGRGGGLRLAVDPNTLRLGDVVRATETDFDMVECFQASTNLCRLINRCRLQEALQQATLAYLAVLDGITLADLVASAASNNKTGKTRKSALSGIPITPMSA
ncbi:MAG: Rrf2 family transcriptional regulator [Comamonadaceae bacterium CG1_02_60_18]|nr:MAG: Rrf2 family transcriptional regulator [Comamonadaceae bacterium CG1_02_60_18]PIQ51409.1 MAG: Rrf2 family transcriptional regulator [Comamonadaceae bacterium CG12_big_fil_rev_8_21_14_0_65_59_15]